MRANLKYILFGTGVALALVLIAAILISGNNRRAALHEANSVHSSPRLEHQEAEAPLHQTQQPLDQAGRSVSDLVSVDSTGALQTALSENDLTRRRELLRQWVLTVPLSAMARTLESSMTIRDPEERSEVSDALESRWAVDDPSSAAALLAKHSVSTPDNSNGSPEWINLLGHLITQWTEVDPNQAVAWAQSQPAGPARSAAVVQISNQLVKEVVERADRNPGEAAEWASGLPAGEWRDRAITGLATIWSQRDPVSAATYTANLSPGSTQNQAVAAVALTWASTNPTQAAQWVAQFPENALRDQVLQGVIVTWAGKAPADAAQWLQGLPQTPSRDCAVNAFCATTSVSSPSTAFQWAETIADQTMRDQQLQNVGGIWLQQEPAEAREAISRSNLSQVVKAHLLANTAPASN